MFVYGLLRSAELRLYVLPIPQRLKLLEATRSEVLQSTGVFEIGVVEFPGVRPLSRFNHTGKQHRIHESRNKTI